MCVKLVLDGLPGNAILTEWRVTGYSEPFSMYSLVTPAGDSGYICNAIFPIGFTSPLLMYWGMTTLLRLIRRYSLCNENVWEYIWSSFLSSAIGRLVLQVVVESDRGTNYGR